MDVPEDYVSLADAVWERFPGRFQRTWLFKYDNSLSKELLKDLRIWKTTLSTGGFQALLAYPQFAHLTVRRDVEILFIHKDDAEELIKRAQRIDLDVRRARSKVVGSPGSPFI